MSEQAQMYLIMKRGLYYRPNARGYTGIKAEAGRYLGEDAKRISFPNGIGGPRDGMEVWPEEDAPDYAPACAVDIKEKHQTAEITRLHTLNAELVEALSNLLFLFAAHNETAVDAYERVAERFYAETGIMAPGKSEPPELARLTFEERQTAYRQWVADFKIRARAVLSSAQAESTGDTS